MTKLITKDAGDLYKRWNLPIVEDVSSAVENAKHNKAPSLLTAEQIERIQAQAYKEAYDAGFIKGREDGTVAGASEISQKGKLLDDLLQSLAQPFSQLDADVEQQLVNLSLAVARQLVRRELKTDPAQIVGVIQQALAVLPVGSRDVRVCLHPEDVIVVKDALFQTEAERTWELVGEPGLLRGDCKILTPSSLIDSTLETRLAAIASQLLGGDRGDDVSSSGAKNNESGPASE